MEKETKNNIMLRFIMNNIYNLIIKSKNGYLKADWHNIKCGLLTRDQKWCRISLISLKSNK